MSQFIVVLVVTFTEDNSLAKPGATSDQKAGDYIFANVTLTVSGMD